MTGSPPPAAASALALEDMRGRYPDCLLAPDPRGAWRTVAHALEAGVPPGRIYLDVLAPAMVDIGALWESARIGVAQEHLATQITQTMPATVSGTPGELDATRRCSSPAAGPTKAAPTAR